MIRKTREKEQSDVAPACDFSFPLAPIQGRFRVRADENPLTEGRPVTYAENLGLFHRNIDLFATLGSCEGDVTGTKTPEMARQRNNSISPN